MNVQILSEYLEYLEVEKGLSENTLEAYRRDLTDFLEFCGADIREIQRSHLNGYIRNLREKEYSSTSVMRKIASLRGFFKWLCASEICRTNPTLTLEQPKVPKRLPKVMTIQEIEAILNDNLNKIERVIVELLYGCGLRVSELVNLNINDFDLKAKYLQTTGKGSKDRIIPLGSKAITAIKNYLPERDYTIKKHRIDTKKLLVKEQGRVLTRQDVYNFIRGQGEKIHKHISPHTLRHSFATHL